MGFPSVHLSTADAPLEPLNLAAQLSAKDLKKIFHE